MKRLYLQLLLIMYPSWKTVVDEAPPPTMNPVPQHVSVHAYKKPPCLIPSFSGKSYAKTATTTICTTNGEYIDPIAPDQCDNPQFALAVHIILTLLVIKAGIHKWGKHTMQAASTNPSAEQRKQVLDSPLFLEQQRDGSMKCRIDARGNKQHNTIPKEETMSPTSSQAFHHFRSYVQAKLISISHVSTAEQIGDIFAKSLPRDQFTC